MLEPKTPLPWKPKPRVFCSEQSTYGIKGEDSFLTVCDFDDPTEPTGQGGFRCRQDADYAIYAANLLPKLLATLEVISGLPKSPPWMLAKDALDLVENYKP